MVETRAKLTNVRISPQKLRLVADMIRGIHVEKALEALTFSNKKGATIIKKVLESAIQNAEHNDAADVDRLSVSSIYVDQGPVMKRMRARAKGRGNRIIKRTSHVTVMVAEK